MDGWNGDPRRLKAALEKAKAAGLMNSDPELIQRAEHFLLRYFMLVVAHLSPNRVK